MRNFGYTLPFLPLLLYIEPIPSTFRNSQLKCFASPIPTANLCSTGLNLLTQLLPQLSLCCLLLTTDRVKVSSSNRGSNPYKSYNPSYNCINRSESPCARSFSPTVSGKQPLFHALKPQHPL